MRIGSSRRNSRCSSSRSLPRSVPAFTVQAYQKNTRVDSPPRTNVFEERPIKPTLFRKMYERGIFPMRLMPTNKGFTIKWQVDLHKIDYLYILPLLFDGLCEIVHPYEFMAQKAIKDLIQYDGLKVVPAIPYLIQPLKRALLTRHRRVVCNTLKVIQILATSHQEVGVVLTQYYNQLLPVFNLYRRFNDNIGDSIDYAQHKRENIVDLVEETLQILDTHGRKGAYYLIKRIIPTYEYFCNNCCT